MPTNLTNTILHQNPQSDGAAWLDIHPSTNKPPPHRANTRLRSRINDIKNTLEHLKDDISTRRHIIALAENNGAYCPICSSSPLPPYCGPTCPLFRDRPTTWLKHDQTWIYFAKQDIEIYGTLQRNVNALDKGVDQRTAADWEVSCSHLQLRMADSQYRWTSRLSVPPVRGLNWDWTFEGCGGKGPDVDVGIAPDEDSHHVDAPTSEKVQLGQMKNATESVGPAGSCFSSTFARWLGWNEQL